MMKSSMTRKILAVTLSLTVYYMVNIGLDRLLITYLPFELGLRFDTTLEGLGLRLPVPAIFTISKLLSAFLAGVAGAYILKKRDYVLLTLPVFIIEAPLLYVALGEGSWLLAIEFLLASMIPVVACCMFGVWLGAGEEHF
jgi:hypothetical protein